MKKIKVLAELIKDGYWKLAYYSFLSAITSRGGLEKAYKNFSKKRYDQCKIVLNSTSCTEYKNKPEDSISDNSSYSEVIWTMWYQGYENAPQIVKEAIDSKVKHAGTHRVIIIDKENMAEYVNIPEWMKNKVNAGIISLAHLSDYVRSALLYKYGGIWIDSTIFVVDIIPEYVFHRNFWSIHWEKSREWIASFDKWSVGVLASVPHSNVMEFCYKCELNYWMIFNYPITYLLLDLFIAIYYNCNQEFHELIDNIEINNTHIFDFVEGGAPKGNQVYDEFEYSYIRKDTWLFQLTYKVNYIDELVGKKTYFGRIREEGLGCGN